MWERCDIYKQCRRNKTKKLKISSAARADCGMVVLCMVTRYDVRLTIKKLRL